MIMTASSIIKLLYGFPTDFNWGSCVIVYSEYKSEVVAQSSP